MKIPNKIKIGGHWIRIHYSSDELGFDKVGRTERWGCKILLQENSSQSVKESILFHEIIHILDWQHELELKENQIGSLAEGFYQVLTDNEFLKK